MPAVPCRGLIETVAEQCTVRQPGQDIAGGQLAQPVLGLLQIADVARQHRDPFDLALLAPADDADRAHRDGAAGCDVQRQLAAPRVGGLEDRQCVGGEHCTRLVVDEVGQMTAVPGDSQLLQR